MQHQAKKLEELRAPLLRTDWPNTDEGRRQREELVDQVDFQVERVQAAVADHRRRIDSYTDTATQIVGLVVGVAVAIILGAVSGGTLGVATIALMASLYATTATMLTKALIKGGAYGVEDMEFDLAVGAVDAVTAAATAGMGSKLIGPMKNLIAKTRVGDVMSWIGKTGLVQKAVEAPVAGKALTAVGKLLPTRAAMERSAAHFMADVATDAITAVPTTFASLALTDTTWQGDPVANFLEGGGMAIGQAMLMGRLTHGAMELGGAAFTTVRSELRMQTEVGRLMEAQRIIGEGYARFREENPAASPAEFLAHPEGRRIRAEIEQRGLMPTLESVNARIKAETDPRVRAAEGDPAHPPHELTKAEARARELEAALPKTLREGTFVTPDPELTGRTVRVEPLRIGDRIVGVDVRVGPDATPLDVALHGATVHAMQKYRGVLGEVRRRLENFGAILTDSGLTVGSAGWEARLEMSKLPSVIASRMDELAGRAMTPELEARVMADLAHLESQYAHHSAVFMDAALRGAQGRGYVAADEAPPDTLAAIKAVEHGLEKGGPRRTNEGEITDRGRADLEYKLAKVRELLDRAQALEARAQETGVREPGAAEASNAAETTLREAAEFYDLSYDELHKAVVKAGETGEPLLLPELARGPAEPEPEAGGPSSSLRRDPAQARLDEMAAALEHPDVKGPKALIAEIAAGGPDAAKAQAALNKMSKAPPEARVVNITEGDLRAALSKNKGRLVRDGLELRVYRVGDDPNAPILYEGTIPRHEPGQPVVYQFGDGELRAWRSPDGVLHQETVIGARRDRMGMEDQIYAHGEGGFAGSALERAHLHGAGLGVESPFGIGLAPREVNQILQNKGIEKYMRSLRDALPKGATLVYETNVVPHPGTSRQANIGYRIDVVINGQRHPFAEFAIGIEIDARGTPRAERLGTRSVVADPIAWRHPTDPRVDEYFSHLREAVDLPQVLVHGLGRRPEIGQVRENLMATPPADVAAVAAQDPRLASHRPASASTFDPLAWEAQLHAKFQAEDPPRYLIVDLRGLGMSRSQVYDILDAISGLPDRDIGRVILLEDE
jgi:hypothetical protein